MVDNLEQLGYQTMTPIQEKSLPHSLDGSDLIAKAKTGSGKTIAFGLLLMQKLNVKKFRIQSMVLCPTRELANQVASELKKLARFTHNVKITTLCGGVPYKPQVHSLSHQAHIIVGTPGRILKHLKEDSFSSEEINTLVLDEADRMLDMGFSEDIHSIIDFLPKQRQTLLFSATYPENIQELSNEILIDPVNVSIDEEHQENAIEELFYFVDESKKPVAVQNMIATQKAISTIIFCNTKIACDQLADDLEDLGIDVLVLHSDLEQRDRNETLTLFASKTYPVLIATDVAARGLDIEQVDLVINYDLPNDDEVYTHRIGRTGRANQKGVSISFEDQPIQENIYEMQSTDYVVDSPFRSIYINGGKKQKVRAGDILGAFTAGLGLQKEDIGKIDIMDFCSYVAVKKSLIEEVYEKLQKTKIKGKYFKSYLK